MRISSKKAITAMMFVLIISSIAVAILAIGISYSYRSLAGTMGIDLSASSLTQRPHSTEQGKIVMKSVTQRNETQTDCNQSCIDTETAGNVDACKVHCGEDYPKVDVNYSRWDIAYTYLGNFPSAVNTQLREKRLRDNVVFESMVYDETTSYLLNYGKDMTVKIIKEKTTGCNGNVTITLSAVQDNNVILYYPDDSKPENKKSFFDIYPFCVSPPEEDVNVSLTGISFDSANSNVSLNASITGSKVEKKCPKAEITMFMSNKTGVETLMQDKNGIDCIFTIDSNRSSAGDWIDARLKYRVKFNITNNIVDIAHDEVGIVALDLSDAYLGNDLNITDEACVHTIAIVPAYIVQSTTVVPQQRNVQITGHDADNNCTGVRVEFIVPIEGNPFVKDTTREFYAYFSEAGNYYDNTDLAVYYPAYWIDNTTGAIPFNTTGYSAENCSVRDGDVRLSGSFCAGGG